MGEWSENCRYSIHVCICMCTCAKFPFFNFSLKCIHGINYVCAILKKETLISKIFFSLSFKRLVFCIARSIFIRDHLRDVISKFVSVSWLFKAITPSPEVFRRWHLFETVGRRRISYVFVTQPISSLLDTNVLSFRINIYTHKCAKSCGNHYNVTVNFGV